MGDESPDGMMSPDKSLRDGAQGWMYFHIQKNVKGQEKNPLKLKIDSNYT